MRNALINYFNRTSSNEQWWSKDDLDKFGKEFYPFLNKKIYLIERRDKTDFTILKNRFGYDIPNDIQEYINLFWHPYIKGFYKEDECIILFPVIKYDNESCDDVLYHENGLIKLADEWESVFGGNIQEFLPIGWLVYTGRYVLYEIKTGKIYIEKYGCEGVPSERPISNSFTELINKLNIDSSMNELN